MEIKTGLEEKREKTSEDSSEKFSYKNFIDIRQFWNNRIKHYSSQFGNIIYLSNIYTGIYNDRQTIIEEKTHLEDKCAVLLSKIKKKEKSLYLYYLNNNDYKLKSHQAITKFVESDLSESKERMDIISNHIEFLSQTDANLVNILYGIKIRFDLEEYTHG